MKQSRITHSLTHRESERETVCLRAPVINQLECAESYPFYCRPGVSQAKGYVPCNGGRRLQCPTHTLTHAAAAKQSGPHEDSLRVLSEREAQRHHSHPRCQLLRRAAHAVRLPVVLSTRDTVLSTPAASHRQTLTERPVHQRLCAPHGTTQSPSMYVSRCSLRVHYITYR